MKLRVMYLPSYGELRHYKVEEKKGIFDTWQTVAWYKTKEDAVKMCEIMIKNPVAEFKY